jgi:hypothetical protein
VLSHRLPGTRRVLQGDRLEHKPVFLVMSVLLVALRFVRPTQMVFKLDRS